MLNQIQTAVNGMMGMSAPMSGADRAWLDWLARDDAVQQADYKTYRKYFDGDHNVPLTDRQKEYLGKSGIEFRFNFLRLPIVTLTQRMRVIGFESPSEALVGDEGLLWQWWQANRMDGKQRGLHRATAVDGDTYAIVEWDDINKRPAITHERAYDGDTGVKVVYDENGHIAFASKRWRSVGVETWRRLNVYTPDTVYKLRSGGDGNWTPYMDEGDNGVWPLQWTDKSGQPLGVPVFHNKHDEDGSNWGRSELEDLIPIQQALNKAVIDMLEGGDKTAYQLITLSGGRASNVKVDPRIVLAHQDPASKWGHIPAGDIKKLVDLKNDYIVTLAQASQVPLSYFQVTGQVASSDTQEADDTGLVAKVEDASVSYGNFWEDVMAMGVKLSNAFGGTNHDPDGISTLWDSFQRVNKQKADRADAEALEIKARTFDLLILSNPRGDRHSLALLAGYDEDEAQMLAESDTIDGGITQ